MDLSIHAFDLEDSQSETIGVGNDLLIEENVDSISSVLREKVKENYWLQMSVVSSACFLKGGKGFVGGIL